MAWIFRLFIPVSLLLAAVSCSTYNNPPIIYRSRVLPREGMAKDTFSVIDYGSLKAKSRVFTKGKRLLIMYVSYDQFENTSIPPLPAGMLAALGDFREAMLKSGIFSDVQMVSFSHFKVGSADELKEISRRFGAGYILVITSAYNFYKYSTTWGNFMAWVPIINFIIPFHRVTGDIFLQASMLTVDGGIVFTETKNARLSENTNILYSPEHFERMSMELHHKTYSELAAASLKRCGYKEVGK
ncbi:MAG: hypothetical protein JXA66_04145 [Oligoflexia bacterium]|nr:hypothetical protein [Oligoflexia bacterium]